MQDTIDKINNYLQVGGLFNPELMEHHKVADLLLECRNEIQASIAANRDVMLHWEVLRSDYDALKEKYQKLVFYLAHIDLDYFTEHDQALLDSAIEEAKKEVLPEQNNV